MKRLQTGFECGDCRLGFDCWCRRCRRRCHRAPCFCATMNVSKSTRSNKSLLPSFKNGIRLSHTHVRRNQTVELRYAAAAGIARRRGVVAGGGGFGFWFFFPPLTRLLFFPKGFFFVV